MDARAESALGLADVLLAQVSPEEQALLPVFGPALVEEGHTQGRKDGALGFGVTDVAWLSVVVPVANAVVGYLLDIIKDSVADVAKERLTGWLMLLRAHRSGSAPPEGSAALSPAIAAGAGRIAYDHAVALGMAEEKARLLQSAVTGSLAAPAL